ncbi:hypothetical protein ACFFJT_06220 [Dyella flava]|uniref:Uncharacterized protein n=1 Tax=Dyella flava TaxID=1920170 RepID=A0ABS2K0Q4_9GAMM|nr:hypothetical protein [Dyella flava]MBM7124837.1 hypothetical protein [Dyella flava]GLQ50882.1 hypothetical protein GCM10010872_23310 [Dyella flava]
MPYRHAVNRLSRSRYILGGALLLLACVAPMRDLQAKTTTSSHKSTSSEPSSSLAIQVNNDRLTLTVAKAPQVYLTGVIDANAPQRFATMVQTGKIAPGSDIYLNATGDDIHAGIALGRLFRQGSMVTHLGTPRLPRHTGMVGKPATCTGACAYAFLGGLYRWAPTGADRIGFPSASANDPKPASADQAPQTPDEFTAYLKDMDIDASALMPLLAAGHGEMVWLTADQMIASRLANNGRLPLVATYQLQEGAPYLVLDEVKRGGEHRMTLQCKKEGVTLTAYNTIGADHARQIVARSARSFFEINRVESQPQQQDNATVDDQSVVVTRTYPASQLGSLISAHTIGAWVRDRSSSLRYGFEFELDGLDRIMNTYYQSCWQYAPWQAPSQKS